MVQIKLIKNKCEIDGCNITECLHLHHIKERTDLEAKEITYSLTRVREMYRDFKQVFLRKNN